MWFHTLQLYRRLMIINASSNNCRIRNYVYSVYAAKLYTAQTNAITNNAAGARLYLTHIVSAPIIAVPSISLFLIIAVRKRMPKLAGNAHENVSVSVNWRSIVAVHTEEPGDTVSRQRGAYRGRARWWMALWPQAPLTPRWSSETRGGRAQTESYTRLHRGKSGSLFPRGTLRARNHGWFLC